MTNTPTASQASRDRVFTILTVLISLGLALMVAEWLVGFYLTSLRSERMDEGLVHYHPRLGWELTANWSGEHEHHDYNATYHIDADGWRVQSIGPAAASKTVAVVGDSFTFGLGVNDGDTFVSQLNAQANSNARFLNRAMPGISTDQQALLLDEHLRSWSAQELWLVVYLANDVIDNTLGWPLQAQQAKPWFSLNNGRLLLNHNPVPMENKPATLRNQSLASVVLAGGDPQQSNALVRSSRLLQLLNNVMAEKPTDASKNLPVIERNLAQPLQITYALLGAIKQQTAANGVELKVILLPGRDAVMNQSGVSSLFQGYLRDELQTWLQGQQIPSVDLLAPLTALPETEREALYYPNEGHLTAAGHAWVAAVLAEKFLASPKN